MKHSYRCWAEVDLNALRENLAWLRHRVGPGVKILTVVKADAYGHGLRQIAALLMQSGSDLFGVANLQEARAIRIVGQGWPILMLGACLPDEVETAVRDGVMPTLSSEGEVRRFAAAAQQAGKTVRVHLKVDTGMGRLGVPAERALELIGLIDRFPGLRLDGLYTHFASAEDDSRFTRLQSRRFRRLLARLAGEGIRVPHIHANNSAALLHEPETTYNLVRPGLLVYGIAPPGRRARSSPLDRQVRPALSLHCRVSLIKEVQRGTPLSYGGTFVTPRLMRVATLTAGYGDGYPRAGSNRAEVLIRGQRCRVLGRVTMDQTLVALPRASGAMVGEEAVLLGRQGDDEITAGELAERCGTVPWEILTNITYRVPRVYRGGQAA
ncbi:MAG: alanine racemase [Verrucomicrobia bacterium]|nr:alanine racemase [Verrucomicrobiota bacterium]